MYAIVVDIHDQLDLKRGRKSRDRVRDDIVARESLAKRARMIEEEEEEEEDESDGDDAESFVVSDENESESDDSGESEDIEEMEEEEGEEEEETEVGGDLLATVVGEFATPGNWPGPRSRQTADRLELSRGDCVVIEYFTTDESKTADGFALLKAVDTGTDDISEPCAVDDIVLHIEWLYTREQLLEESDLDPVSREEMRRRLPYLIRSSATDSVEGCTLRWARSGDWRLISPSAFYDRDAKRVRLDDGWHSLVACVRVPKVADIEIPPALDPGPQTIRAIALNSFTRRDFLRWWASGCPRGSDAPRTSLFAALLPLMRSMRVEGSIARTKREVRIASIWADMTEDHLHLNTPGDPLVRVSESKAHEVGLDLTSPKCFICRMPNMLRSSGAGILAVGEYNEIVERIATGSLPLLSTGSVTQTSTGAVPMHGSCCERVACFAAIQMIFEGIPPRILRGSVTPAATTVRDLARAAGCESLASRSISFDPSSVLSSERRKEILNNTVMYACEAVLPHIACRATGSRPPARHCVDFMQALWSI